MISSARIHELLRFAAVGAINTALDLLVLNALLLMSPQEEHTASFSMFKAISFLVAVINSYVMNRYWTFAGTTTRNTRVEFGQFLGVSLVGLAVNNVVATLVFRHAFVPSRLSAMRATIAALAGSAAALTWNYIGYKLFVFKRRGSDVKPPTA